ncbi:hypothetical protein KFL_000600230 [Klebsormidium nitens]|uniref:Uncharacterized protein n=1 Tax=Klebsormidium nitens TaxID=105231 RepID=A0A1Y1HW26_KLENI|nr:hypothetical protein KFL_000600230 [Klebsormidium nitens]|eukprot:GAQ80706.1 hypothetical protein KFL_000600230 [Klebsormidium nitens]
MAPKKSPASSSGINHAAILLLTIIHQLLGGLWYGQLFKDPWLHGVGKSLQDVEPKKHPALFLIPLVAGLLLNYVLAGILALGPGPSVKRGVVWALILWGGVILPDTLTHHAFIGAPLMLTAIDTSKELVGLLISGVILGSWTANKTKAA